MFKRLRIAVLLYVLLFVAAAQYLTARRSTDWDSALWVDVYTVDGDGRPATRDYLARFDPDEFRAVERFFAAEARRHGVTLEQPFKVRFIDEFRSQLPAIGRAPSVLEVLSWSLHMRWLAARLQWQSREPSGDIVVFAVYHEASDNLSLDNSTALEKGQIAVANLFADRSARGSNAMVLAHELLHTLGATDKYEPGSGMPRYPDGYADPEAKPRLPQRKAELMAGRTPLDDSRAEIPRDLTQVVIGPLTALEIGWRR